jgi:hypothetical protein
MEYYRRRQLSAPAPGGILPPGGAWPYSVVDVSIPMENEEISQLGRQPELVRRLLPMRLSPSRERVTLSTIKFQSDGIADFGFGSGYIRGPKQGELLDNVCQRRLKVFAAGQQIADLS